MYISMPEALSNGGIMKKFILLLYFVMAIISVEAFHVTPDFSEPTIDTYYATFPIFIRDNIKYGLRMNTADSVNNLHTLAVSINRTGNLL